jgi:hypothetical protein
MNSGDKLKATFFIWAAFVLASLFTIGGHDLNAVALFMGLIYTIAALSATYFVMDAKVVVAEEPVKAKRSRVDRLLSSLDDDELDTLRDRLSQSDGEVVSLEDVLRKGKG